MDRQTLAVSVLVVALLGFLLHQVRQSDPSPEDRVPVTIRTGPPPHTMVAPALAQAATRGATRHVDGTTYVRYRVQQGDTLEQLCATFHLDRRLLLKLNGLKSPQLQPGRELRLLRGPCRAEVDPAQDQLLVFLGSQVLMQLPVSIVGLPSSGTYEILEKHRPEEAGSSHPILRLGESLWIAAGQPDEPEGTVISVTQGDAELLLDYLVTGSPVTIR